MQGYVNGLLDGIADTPEKQQHYLHIIQEKTNAMNALVESLFLLSKLDLGQVPFHDECVNLADFLQDWYQECASRYEHASIKLTVKCPQPVQVLMDRTHFIRVLDNLCQNSIKYRSENPVHGLGLSITKQIITQMKGEISASGELNKGLCITIRLPLLQGGTTL